MSLSERGGAALQWELLRERVSSGARSPLGKARVLALEPSAEREWIAAQQTRTAEMRPLVTAGALFNFRGLIDPKNLLDKARIQGAALEAAELLDVLAHAERVAEWTQLVMSPPDAVRCKWPAIEALSAPLLEFDLGGLLRTLQGKIEPDGSLADDASPDLARIRREMARQHRAIEDTLRRALGRLSEDGSVQDALITVRGERFVIPVKVEARRKVQGVVHGSSSTGQTVFVEPLETIEANNELVRLLDEEQAEIHRILVMMTRAVATNAASLQLGAEVLAQVDAHQAVARFAEDFACVRPSFEGEFALEQARHPLLEMRLRESDGRITPLDIMLPAGPREMIISGPNTGGKTVALKTSGLLVLMAQAGMPVPAMRATLPLFTAVYADIGDAQSIEQNLSTFSAHVVNVDRISRVADDRSLVLLDELGSATDPEEGAALAVAVAKHFLARNTWTFITTHLTALKVYAAGEAGVFNAAVGFDEATLSPTYELRLGVPGASAGLNIAARLGMDPAIVEVARAQRTTQQADIARFLDELHNQLGLAAQERETLAETQRKLDNERSHLAVEGRAQMQAYAREMRRDLEKLIEEFEGQLRDTVKAIDDKTVAKKIARDAAVRIAGLKREFGERFQSTVAAKDPTPASAKKQDNKREPKAGDLVRLKSLNSEGRVARVIDAKTLEVNVGAMKMRVPMSDVLEVTPVRERPIDAVRRRGGGVHVQSSSSDSDYMTTEINVIGRTADEAEGEVDRFVEQAFLAGLPRVRVVHGVGMGILRRTLRDFLKNHPHVASITEPPYNEGGQGATVVELRN
ncbi:endonuclease MutS2 [Granulicella cerasi]|uniref:Endonuclease MutS2 n=1 Tax=Granulicella cerasi TaxID=741063 RepID=A0ABW1ZAF7_9BACT|nr:Smr/MutS family protein [Granulicella cerasi]